MKNIWYLNTIGTQATAESCLEYKCLENILEEGRDSALLLLAVKTGVDLHKAVENFLYAHSEYHFHIDVKELTLSQAHAGQVLFIEQMTSALTEQGLFIQRPSHQIPSTGDVWEEFLRQFSKIPRAPKVYFILEQFSFGNPEFNDFLRKIEKYTGSWLRFILLLNRPLSCGEHTIPLVQQAKCITYDNFRLSEQKAQSYLDKNGITISNEALNIIWRVTEGWALPSDLLLRKTERDPTVLENIQKQPISTILYLPELRVFFEETLFNIEGSWKRDLLLKCSVDNRLCDEYLRFLNITKEDVSITEIVAECPYITCTNMFEQIYEINPVVQSFLYYLAQQKFGTDTLTALHVRSAEYFSEKLDWKRVLAHRLQQGNLQEASMVFRYLAFQPVNTFMIEGYKELVRRSPISILENSPWVQVAYAMSIKYQHPNIAIQFFDKAMRGFCEKSDMEGEILAFCQKVSVGFFSPSHKSEILNQQMLRRFCTAPNTAMSSDVLMDSYRKIFLAYAFIQLGIETESACELLEDAEKTGVILQEKNLLLWVNFVRVLYYSNRSDARALKHVVMEAIELSESGNIQAELKMYLWQTVAFVFFIKNGMYDQARRYCERAHTVAHEIGASGYQVYVNLIYTYALDCLREFNAAEEIIQETENISRNIFSAQNGHLWAYYLIGQAYHYFLKGDDTQIAFYAAESAIRLSRESKRTSYLARSLLVMSSIQMKQGNFDLSEKSLQECLDITDTEKYYFYHISAEYQQAVLYHKRGENKAFYKALTELLGRARSAGIYHFNFTAPWELQQILCDGGINPEAEQYLQTLCNRNSIMFGGFGKPIDFYNEGKEFYFFLLGDFRYNHWKKPASLTASPKVRYLLEMLTASEDPIGITKIVAEMWPNQNQKQAMNSFYFTLHQLRKLLDAKNMVRYEKKYCWLDKAYYSSDWQEFCHWREQGICAQKQGNLPACWDCFDKAIALCRGPFLAAENLEQYLDIEKRAADRQIYQVCMEYGTLLLKNNQPQKASDILRKGALNEFVQEELYRLLMAAYYLAGNKKDACELYQTLEKKLLMEMDAAPHAMSRQMYECIRQGADISQFI